MAHCININHPEYKKLVPQFKGPEALLKAKISIWQENNGLDNFPTIDQLEERKNILYDKMSIEEKIQGKQFQKLTAEEKAKTIEQSNILLGVNIQNQEQLEFHINTLNVVSKFLENAGIETRLVEGQHHYIRNRQLYLLNISDNHELYLGST